MSIGNLLKRCLILTMAFVLSCLIMFSNESEVFAQEYRTEEVTLSNQSDVSSDRLVVVNLRVDYTVTGNLYEIKRLSGSYSIEGIGTVVCWSKPQFSVDNSTGIQVYSTVGSTSGLGVFSAIGGHNTEFEYWLTDRNVYSNDSFKITFWITSLCGFEQELANLLNESVQSLNISDPIVSELFSTNSDYVESTSFEDWVIYVGQAGCGRPQSVNAILYDQKDCTGGMLTLNSGIFVADLDYLFRESGNTFLDYGLTSIQALLRRYRNTTQPNLLGSIRSAPRSLYVPDGTVALLLSREGRSVCVENSIADFGGLYFGNTGNTSDIVYSNVERILFKKTAHCSDLDQVLQKVNGEYQVPQSLILDVPFNQQSQQVMSQPFEEQRTCSSFVSQASSHVYLFSNTNCQGEITWFSAHPESGPSSNSNSLFVPANSYVEVSSGNDGSGEKACFSSPQANLELHGWKNKIQWAKLVRNASCPVPTSEKAEVELFHKQDYDHRFHTIKLGETWYNNDSKIVESIVVQGSVRAIFKHRSSGAEECWDYSNSDLYGDWHLQTKWVRVESGKCANSADILATFYVHDEFDKKDGWLDIKKFGYFHMDDLNDGSNSMQFHYENMSVLICKHSGLTGPCYCRTSSDPYFRNNRFSDGTVVEDELSSGFLFSNNSCQGETFVPSPRNFADGENVEAQYFEYTGQFPGLPILGTWTPVRISRIGNIDLGKVGPREDGFALKFRSCLAVPSSGYYTFFTESDDGSMLSIDGQMVVDNRGSHSKLERSGVQYLEAGSHSLEVQYYEGGGGQFIGVSWDGPTFTKDWIPNSALSLQGCGFFPEVEPTLTPTPVIDETVFQEGTGVAFEYYEHSGEITSLPLDTSLVPKRTGVSAKINLTDLQHRSDNFAASFKGCFNVPTTGQYTFFTTSDEGSELYIDGQKVVDNDGMHPPQEKSGTIYLQSGLHNIQVQYFDSSSTQELAVKWIGPGGGSAQEIPTSRLSRSGCNTFTSLQEEYATDPSAFDEGTGVFYKYYEYSGDLTDQPVSYNWIPVKTGTVSDFTVNQLSPSADKFAVQYYSCFNVPASGQYTFITNSDDGSELYIDGQKVVDNDGIHGLLEKRGLIHLNSGIHSIAVHYFNAAGSKHIDVRWIGPGGGSGVTIPSSRLSIKGCEYFEPSAPAILEPDQFGPGTGVSFKYFEVSEEQQLPLGDRPEQRTGVTSNFNLIEVGHREDQFAVQYQGCFQVPSGGEYTFITQSDEQAAIYIDGELIVSNYDSGRTQSSGNVFLETGVHAIEVEYLETVGDQYLDVRWIGPGGGSGVTVPSSRLSVTGCTFSKASANFTYEVVSASTVNLDWDPYQSATGYTIYYSYDGAALQPFYLQAVDEYNGWAGFSCGAEVVLQLKAETTSGQVPLGEVQFTAHACPLESFSQYRLMFGDGNNGFYAIDQAGGLYHYWHRIHNGKHVAEGKTHLGNGWQIYNKVFANGAGYIYAIDHEGKLFRYGHTITADNASTWSGPYHLGNGWQIFDFVTPDFRNGIFGIDAAGKLDFYRHGPELNAWFGPYTAGNGWTIYDDVFADGKGGIYAIDTSGQLFYYRHSINSSGVSSWQPTHHVGNGWKMYDYVFSDGDGGVIARDTGGNLFYYEHNSDNGIGLRPGGYQLNGEVTAAQLSDGEVFNTPIKLELSLPEDARQIYLPFISR